MNYCCTYLHFGFSYFFSDELGTNEGIYFDCSKFTPKLPVSGK